MSDLEEMLTPMDIMNSFPKIKIGNTYRIPKDKYIKWVSNNIKNTIYL